MRYLVLLSILLCGTFSQAMDKDCEVFSQQWKDVERRLENNNFEDLEDLFSDLSLPDDLDLTDACSNEDLTECFEKGAIDLKQFPLSNIAQKNLLDFLETNRREERKATIQIAQLTLNFIGLTCSMISYLLFLYSHKC
jgi:hypothetical protein